MWIFVWEASEDRNAQSIVRTCTDSAWEVFKDLTIEKLPDYILRMTSDTTVVVYNWSEFMNICNEEREIK